MLLLDNSAWARLDLPSLPAARRTQVAEMIEADEIAICTPFLLEAGWSARDPDDHDELLSDLLQLPRCAITPEVENTAIDAQRDLARRGQHRSASPTDLLIAACAHHNGLGVLHYDRDYDLLLAHTKLRFESQWLAVAGAL